MTNKLRSVIDWIVLFYRHNTKAHAIKFSIFPQTHERERRNFRKYLLELDTTYTKNRSKSFEKYLKQAREELSNM